MTGRPGRPTARHRRVGFRLGVPWAWSGLRSSSPAAWGTVVGCLVLTTGLLLTLSSVLGVAASQRRDAARNPHMSEREQASFLHHWSTSPYRDDQLTLVAVRAVGSRPAPAPPGLQRLPNAGEAWVSPALQEAMSRDPGLRGRVPGKVTGLVGDEGLASPDELYAMVGIQDLEDGRPSDSWGTSWAPDDHPRAPLGAGAAILLVLVGLPMGVLALSVARLAGAGRRRRCSALALLGVPHHVLSRAVAVEAGVQALLGSLTGVALAAVLAPISAERGWLGATWFGDEAWPPTVLVVGSVLVVVAAVAVLAARQMAAVVREPLLTNREPAPLRAPMLRVGVLAVGMLALSSITLLSARGDASPLASGAAAWAFLVAVAVAVTGLIIGLPVLVTRLGAHLPGRRRNLVLMLAGARLSRHGSTLVAANVGLAALLVGGFTGVAVVADMDAGNAPPPAGEIVLLSTPGNRSAPVLDAFRRVLALPTVASVLQVTPDPSEDDVTRGSIIRSTSVGTCSSVIRLAAASAATGAGSAEAVAAIRARCRDGSEIAVSPREPDPPGTLPSFVDGLVPGLSGSSRLLTVPTVDARVSLDNPILYAMAGPGESARDDYLNAALGLVPVADVQIEGQNTYAPIIPLLGDLIARSTIAGILLALVSFLLVVLDQRIDRRVQEAPLVVVGAPQRVLARVALVQSTVVTVVVTVMGVVVGWQACAAYVAVGHSGASALRLPLPASSVLGLVVLQGLAIAATSRTRRGGDDLVADMRTT